MEIWSDVTWIWKTNLAEGQYANLILWVTATFSFGPIHPTKSSFAEEVPAMLKILFTGCICECSANFDGLLEFTFNSFTLWDSLLQPFKWIFYNQFYLCPTFFHYNVQVTFHLHAIYFYFSGWAELVTSLIWADLSARKMRLSTQAFLLTVYIFFCNS